MSDFRWYEIFKSFKKFVTQLQINIRRRGSRKETVEFHSEESGK